MEKCFENELIHESSPYLLQHAHNPVYWYPWGEKALNKARDENKMMIISIGYSTCHWCHVMERECFEDIQVAKLMNENFINIKVDREERPDIDQIYMYVSYVIHGTGGWPLNVFALPDGSPFYAGTYFPKARWIEIIRYFVELYRQFPDKIQLQAESIKNYIIHADVLPPLTNNSVASINDINQIYIRIRNEIDFNKGGNKRVPKFPMPANWEYLLYYYYLTKNQEALNAVNVTLHKMAFGGIYDHVGGGFSRYSTDENWHVPHFEKMLYDNAQLVSLYSHAYQVTRNELYKEVVFHTLNFIERELTSSESGFYSAIDADSDGEEGKYYVWTKNEIEQVLGADANLFIEFYNVKEHGNWEHGKNVLFQSETINDFIVKHQLSPIEFRKYISYCKQLLQSKRSERTYPHVDDKIITSWNALMLKAYIDAYQTFNEQKFLGRAIANAQFLCKNLIDHSNQVFRIYKNGKSSIKGFLDDYAFLISAFIHLYQATFDEYWLYKAKSLTDYVIQHFYDKNSGMFFYSQQNQTLLNIRKMEITDNVIPSSNSEMAKSLFLLGKMFQDEKYMGLSKHMLFNVQENAHNNMFFYSNWGILELHFVSRFFEVVIVGPACEKMRKELVRNYLPNVVIMGTDNRSDLELLKNRYHTNQTLIYVCSDGACQLPVTQIQDAINLIE